MTLTRSDLLVHLQNTFAALATVTGQATTDSAAGYGPAIDYTLRTLGTAQADLATGEVATGSEQVGLWLAEYAALRRFQAALVVKATDLRIDGPLVDKKRSQMMKNIEALLGAIKEDLTGAGYLNDGFSLGRLQLDFLEPEAVA